jgi:SAM-dependent methyltransferase
MRTCRFCGTALEHVFCDLGMSPLSNSLLEEADLEVSEPFYPLCAYVCSECFLVQLEEYERPDEIFKNYVYLSSYSDTWLEHARRYAAQMSTAMNLGPGHLVVEVGSNDGYLLQFFRERGIPVLGIEPAENIAVAAQGKGIETIVKFFGTATARELAGAGRSADLLLGNNVLAHVPGLNDFVAGLKILLKPRGIITLEFPHLMNLMRETQFDTMYHEHFSYFSFYTVERVFARHGLTLYDVERLPTHGGSLRIYAAHSEDTTRSVSERVLRLREDERAFGMSDLKTYRGFLEAVGQVKRTLREFLTATKASGKTVAGYGAPAKATTLLNYCGVRADLLPYTVDRSPQKQGRYVPGVRIPIHPPARIFETRPDYVLVLPWNIKDEIIEYMGGIREWGGRFVVPVPKLTVL